MGVRAALRAGLGRWALRRPHLLLVTIPGATAVRLAVDAYAARQDAVLAPTPADADVLVVAGDPDQELGETVERLWGQLPGPRSRARVTDPAAVESALRDACGRLGDAHQVEDAAARHDEWAGSAQHQKDGRHSDHGGGQSHGGHEGHGGDGMEMPGGLMMADRATDRDGLKLDVLHVPLGPVLPLWPAGLVVDTVLQGDVVQHAGSRVLGPATSPSVPFWLGGEGEERRRRHAAAHLDSLGRFLGVAGWERAAVDARRVRDASLAGEPLDEVHARLTVLERRLLRSRTLRWATTGLGVLEPDAAARMGVSGPASRAAGAGGDVYARWRRWLLEAERLLAGQDPEAGEGPRGEPDGARALLDAAARLMVGLDVAAARLVLASFDPDPDELVAVGDTR